MNLVKKKRPPRDEQTVAKASTTV